ncbi:hypothetical protein EYC08_20285 [Tabrizicola sp. WMC-M-20]|nr:hypothetical protein EYC08_20285 [Tabrizicola sp. WMC-M-20]
MKYLLGVGVLVSVVVGYLLLTSGGPSEPMSEAAAPATAPVAPAPVPASGPATLPAASVAPKPTVLQTAVPDSPDQNALLGAMAADARESLPLTLSDMLTLTDAVFLPRMRIMEYTYVTTATDARTSARAMRDLIETGAESFCIKERDMFGMGVTLRHSFADRNGTLFQRVYLLPEDCAQFY